MRYHFFVSKYFLFILCFGFFSNCWAEDVAVHLAIVDGEALTEKMAKAHDDLIQKINPTMRLISLRVDKRKGFLGLKEESQIRSEMLSMISSMKIASSDKIKLMVLTSHGHTDGESTFIEDFGSFTDVRIDDSFAEILGFLRPFVDNRMKLVLNACFSLCGDTARAATRARLLLQFLGAEEGEIFGTINEKSSNLKYNMTAKTFFIWTGHALATTALFKGVSTSLLYKETPIMIDPLAAISSVNGDQLFELGAFVASISLAVSTLVPGYQYISTYLRSKSKQLNEGRIFSFSNGELSRIENVSTYFNREKVFGYNKDSCTQIFGYKIN